MVKIVIGFYGQVLLGIEDNVLIAFIIKVISIIFKKMLTYTGSFKPKPKNSNEFPTHYLSGFPLDNNRKSIPNPNHLPKVNSSR